jgi:hypothetical protein
MGFGDWLRIVKSQIKRVQTNSPPVARIFIPYFEKEKKRLASAKVTKCHEEMVVEHKPQMKRWALYTRRMTYMARIEWSEELSVGLEVLDKQHKLLIYHKGISFV